MTTFKVGDRVRVTEEYAAWYKRNFYGTGFINGDTNLIVTAIQSDGGILVATEDRNVVVHIADAKYLIPTVDTAQAVIEAARALMRHVSIGEYEGEQGTLTEISLFANGVRQYWHEDMADKTLWKDDDFITAVVALSAALEAHDEATIESEDEG